MKKGDRAVLVTALNEDVLRSALTNAAKIFDAALEIPVVDPKDLSIDDNIYGIVVGPVNDVLKDGKKLPPSAGVYAAMQPIIVESLTKKAKPGFITVNNTVDIPLESGRLVKPQEAFFANEEDARMVCRVITDIELERSLEREAIEKEIQKFLNKQRTDDRY